MFNLRTMLFLLVFLAFTPRAINAQDLTVKGEAFQEMLKKKSPEKKIKDSKRRELLSKRRNMYTNIKELQYKHLVKYSMEQHNSKSKERKHMAVNVMSLINRNTANISMAYLDKISKEKSRIVEIMNEEIDFWNSHQTFNPEFWVEKCKEIGKKFMFTDYLEKQIYSKQNKKAPEYIGYECKLNDSDTIMNF